jgi:hypothetical protein
VQRATGRGIRIHSVIGGSLTANQVYDDRAAGKTTTHGIRLFVLAGEWDVADNRVWGVTTQLYENAGGHTATFVRPYRLLTATQDWNPGAINDDDATSTVINVGGAEMGDIVTVATTALLNAGASLTANVSAAGQVRVVLTNHTGAAFDLPNGTVRVKVEKYL